ncbi:MAG: prolyl aminopeptidase [Pseudomonadota bacterium]
MPDKKNTNRPPPLLDIFPAIEPYSTGHLAVDDTHQIYWEQSGNPDGQPIVVFHGGPGAGTSPVLRQFFDPDHYRIIMFDQRGCGKSTPHGSLKDNTTKHLISDIEKLREHLSIERWHIFGGSWGSTLALSYAAIHADKVTSMILRGIFLMRPEEIHWFIHGMQTIFPEAWEQFISILNEEERADILNSYYKRLTSDDENVFMEAAIDWSTYESACAALIPNYQIITTQEQKLSALSISRIEAHYFLHEDFTDENALLSKIYSFRHIPTEIIQGRYDMVCPIKTAYELHQAWPEAEYHVVPDGGHSAMDPSIRSHLVEATEKMKKISV